MTETAKQKRPASHRWAIGIFGFTTACLTVMSIDIFRGRSGVTLGPYLSLLLYFFLGALGFLALVLGGRRRWGYYVCSGALGIWSLRGLYTVALFFHYSLIRGYTFSGPRFHLAQRDKLFVVQEQTSAAEQVLITATIGLLIWLFMRFAFGRPSRRYFGFEEVEKI